MNERPLTLREKLNQVPDGVNVTPILDAHASVKRPHLFYWEDAIDAWIPAPEKVEHIVSAENGDVGDEIEIRFKIVELTDAEYEAMPVD